MKRLDLVHHLVYSFALAIAGAFLLGALWGVVVALALGVAKELYDAWSPAHRFDWLDLAANGVGLVAAAVVLGVGL